MMIGIMKGKINKFHVAGAGILVLVLLAVFFLTYKAQMMDIIYKPVKLTLSSVHKRAEEFQVTLSQKQPAVSENFLCTLPDVKTIGFTVAGVEGNDLRGFLKASLTDTETGDLLAEETYPVSSLGEDEILKLRVSDSVTIPGTTADSVSADSGAAAGTVTGSAYAGTLNRPLTFHLTTEGTVLSLKIHITANIRQGLVISYNGDETERINLLSYITYSDGQGLKGPYILLCVVLLVFSLLTWWLLICRGRQLHEVFLPLALVLGAVFCVLIPAYSVPDENIHMENAYKYSNRILGVEDTGKPGETIYKRRCDVLQADLMGNTLESNSYMQMAKHLFDRPDAEEKELTEARYSDVGKMVPAVNYIPCALGISLGRLLGFSSLLTLTLGRYFSLIVFALLSFIAIRLLPYGKNAAAMLMLLPIALQQGASSSYDSLLNGAIILFVACCLNLYEAAAGNAGRVREKETSGKKEGAREKAVTGDTAGMKVACSGALMTARRNINIIAVVITAAVLTLYFAQTKGGVYLPLCILLIVAVFRYVRRSSEEKRGFAESDAQKTGSADSEIQRAGSTDSDARRTASTGTGSGRNTARRRIIFIAVAAVIIVACAFFFGRMVRDFLAPLLESTDINGGEGYSLAWLLSHPMDVIYKYWATFQEKGYDYLNGLMGGYLSWLDIKVNRLYPIAFLFGTIVLAHTEGDRFCSGRPWRAVLLGTGILDILLIMFSMLLAWSTTADNAIDGVQGRYFIGFAILFFLGATTRILRVDRTHSRSAAMAMMVVEVLTVLSVVAVVR